MTAVFPKVSIGIPVYNRAHLVRRAIESALAQTYPNLEVIVVDNCSTDGTYAVVQEYMGQDDRVKGLQNEQNLGPVPNWWRCIEQSQGEYFKMLFSDDWLEPDAVEQLLHPLQQNPTLGFTYSPVIQHLADEPPRLQYDRIPPGQTPAFEFLLEFAVDYLHYTVPLSPGAALFRRADILQAFTLSLTHRIDCDCNRYGIGVDSILYWKTCDRYPQIFRVPQPVVHFAEAVGEEPGFSMSLVRSGRQQILFHCYQSAFGHFLAQSQLPRPQRELLHTALFLQWVLFHPPQLRLTVPEFELWFPPRYPWWQLRFSHPKIQQVLQQHNTREQQVRQMVRQHFYHQWKYQVGQKLPLLKTLKRSMSNFLN
ncbi:hypothetical protein BST81_08625 [Leptolyngbya sp. 'hensonii']|uniref:glycosyltransferase family 2 protein n=1 Tax=Leptolyngbya sp. 'hensonii' TaxID=1922337 RepID=UPI00094F4DE1|nr:glycosyltransferase family 2 protein [Leptolyngbya sp. 'hensonii']OLP18794.1 hypothetical protein BST81_08625 [Leptolyngbya sp. 'hensonii']